jgi:hypothetical protein
MRVLPLLMATLGLYCGGFIAATKAQGGTYVNAWREFRGPQAYKDIESGVTFYVESDGRHVAALSSIGTVLWNRDPFADGHLERYRVEKPRIVGIDGTSESMIKRLGFSGRFISIRYDSTQFGVMDMKTGEFHFLGQD